MLDQILELFLKNELRPSSFLLETAELDRKVNRSELTAILMLHFRGQQTMSALADRLGVPLSTTTSLVKRLVQKGMVERTQSTKDQRIMNVELTDEGLKLALQANVIMESMLKRIQNSLSKEELEQFLSLAVRVGRAIQGERVTEKRKTTDSTIRKIMIDD